MKCKIGTICVCGHACSKYRSIAPGNDNDVIGSGNCEFCSDVILCLQQKITVIDGFLIFLTTAEREIERFEWREEKVKITKKLF